MNKTRSLGEKGEEMAAEYLRQKGYKIVERNLRTPYGEIDLIAKKGKLFAVIEVKTRSDHSFGGPEGAVNKKKQDKIKRSILWWFQKEEQHHSEVRLDVIGILKKSEHQWEIEHWEGAFE